MNLTYIRVLLIGIGIIGIWNIIGMLRIYACKKFCHAEDGINSLMCIHVENAKFHFPAGEPVINLNVPAPSNDSLTIDEFSNQIIRKIWPDVEKYMNDEFYTIFSTVTIKNLEMKLENIQMPMAGEPIIQVDIYNSETVRTEYSMFGGLLHVQGNLVKLKGSARIVINTNNEPPFISGLEFYFIDTPDFDFTLSVTAFWVNFDAKYLMGNYVRKKFAETLQSYVYPNTQIIDFSKKKNDTTKEEILI